MNFNHRHYPKHIEENTIFRWFFLLRKSMFSKKSVKVYGQNGEDLIINRLFPKSYKGVYVDVGCFHPQKYSNTYLLYKNGWRGVNIDIDSIKIDAFNKSRPNDYNVVTAISNKVGVVDYYSNGYYSPTTTLDKEFSKSDKRNFTDYELKKVKANTLTNVLDHSPFSNSKIDLLSIDVEGHDFKVLESLNFDKYKPKVIAVETDAKSMDEVQDGKIYQFLKEQDYQLINWVGMTLIWEIKNLK